jgi:hypothetical protein
MICCYAVITKAATSWDAKKAFVAIRKLADRFSADLENRGVHHILHAESNKIE